MGLTFKNGGKASDYNSDGKKKKKKKSHKKSKDPSKHVVSSPSSGAPSGASQTQPADMSQRKGTGSVLHSSTIVTGIDTRFLSELSQGDAFVLRNPSTGKDELRVVRFITSDQALALSSAFSFPCPSSSSSFKYVKAPKKLKSASELQAESTAKFNDTIDKAAGTTNGGKVEIRIKNSGGGYNIVQQAVDPEMSREELVNLRASKKSDRYC
ncbi:hypothetical protein TrCOL_g11563 [Triparma columacea]|uniref:Uncharacterized protein n=1 Tax=Triparma columacea TaxID=722753 RepID=A0A9W7G673_9STRA|nr:hypothetical protein TrCOL_g11563 [Triparma columacea]